MPSSGIRIWKGGWLFLSFLGWLKNKKDKERNNERMQRSLALLLLLVSLVGALVGEDAGFVLGPGLLLDEETMDQAGEDQQDAEEMIDNLLQQTTEAFNALFKDFPFDQVLQGAAVALEVEEPTEYYFVPRTDIYETETELRFEVELPTLDEKDLSVTVDNNVLIIQGVCDPLQRQQDAVEMDMPAPVVEHTLSQQEAKQPAPAPGRPLALPQMPGDRFFIVNKKKRSMDEEEENDGMDKMEGCKKEYIRIERPHGKFLRQFLLPAESLGETVWWSL